MKLKREKYSLKNVYKFLLWFLIVSIIIFFPIHILKMSTNTITNNSTNFQSVVRNFHVFNGINTSSSLFQNQLGHTIIKMNQATQGNTKKNIVLHRKKRYLLFPEGSSFQLVFDLIIPIVDYTNFAIMGITCSVAWELPSQPPSEIIHMFRGKLSDGTFGIGQRRNDILTLNKHFNNFDYQILIPTSKSEQNQKTSNRKSSSFINPKKLFSFSTSSSPSSSTNKNDKNHIKNTSYQEYIYNQLLYPQRYRKTKNLNSSAVEENGLSLIQGSFSTDHKTYKSNKITENKFIKSPYYTYAKNQKFIYLHKKQKTSEEQHKNKISNINDNSRGKYYEPESWERSQERIESNWPTKQGLRTITNKYRSKSRKILLKPQKHRIYPVFSGKRKRRYIDNDEISEEQIHLREHLRTRQKMFKKIGKLYSAHGLNGTDCVLRALCEAGQRQYTGIKRVLHNEQHNKKIIFQEKTEPQSFITELLRAIFVLPNKNFRNEHYVLYDNIIHNSLSSLPIDEYYLQAFNENNEGCEQKYYTCKDESVWSDF